MTTWTEDALLQLARELPENQLRAQDVENNYGTAPVTAAFRKFGGWRQVVEAVGREYPGNYKWRTKWYRRNPDLFTAELPAVPKAKLASTHEFCAEQGLDRPVVVNQRLCLRCQKIWVQKPRKYCGSCVPIVNREKTRERLRRFHERRKKPPDTHS